MAPPSVLRTFLLTALALTAFAANSVLCRAALGRHLVDAGSFTVIRLVSGILVLLLLVRLKAGAGAMRRRPHWAGPAALFVYAVSFSFAYLTLDTGTGALILFGAVQTTMIASAVVLGGRLRVVEWLGLAVAFAGFVVLVLPSVSTPSVWGFVLMSLAGAAWGVYTLRGKGSANPLADTAANFVWTLPAVSLLGLVVLRNASVSTHGILLAVLSGGVASGMGYAVWYAALRGMTATQAAVVQLTVPLIAALGGIVFSGETITGRYVGSTVLVLGGIALVIVRRRGAASPPR